MTHRPTPIQSNPNPETGQYRRHSLCHWHLCRPAIVEPIAPKHPANKQMHCKYPTKNHRDYSNSLTWSFEIPDATANSFNALKLSMLQSHTSKLKYWNAIASISASEKFVWFVRMKSLFISSNSELWKNRCDSLLYFIWIVFSHCSATDFVMLRLAQTRCQISGNFPDIVLHTDMKMRCEKICGCSEWKCSLTANGGGCHSVNVKMWIKSIYVSWLYAWKRERERHRAAVGGACVVVTNKKNHAVESRWYMAILQHATRKRIEIIVTYIFLCRKLLFAHLQTINLYHYLLYTVNNNRAVFFLCIYSCAETEYHFAPNPTGT